MIIMLREEFSRLLFPHISISRAPENTSLEDRCKEIASVFGYTPREIEVLTLLAKGRNEPYIEKALHISRTTVKAHINNLYQKTGVRSRQELLDVIEGSRD